MDWWNKFALWIWRDRGGYDPTIGTYTEDYNVSVLTRFRRWRYRNRGRVKQTFPWLLPAIIGAAATLAAVAIPLYLDAAKADKQVQSNPGELLLRCVQEPDNVLRCRPIERGENKVIARSDSRRLDDKRPAQP